MILVLRTDSSEAYCGLYKQKHLVAEKKWEAARELSQQILAEIEGLLQAHGSSLNDLQGIVFFKGPGSYTGLRIGASVANALGYSYGLPVVASTGEDWADKGLNILDSVHGFSPIAPEYGGNARVTQPKK